MLVLPGPALEAEDRGSPGAAERARMRVTGSAISRESRVGAVLGHDERAAVGGVAPSSVVVGAATRASDSPACAPVGTETGPASGAKRR